MFFLYLFVSSVTLLKAMEKQLHLAFSLKLKTDCHSIAVGFAPSWSILPRHKRTLFAELARKREAQAPAFEKKTGMFGRK